MKKILFGLGFLCLAIISCKETDRQLEGTTEDDTNTANTFLRAALDGDYAKARKMLVQDSLNAQDMDASERIYNERMTQEEKDKYRGASITIHNTRKVDSVTSIIEFSNTFRKERDSLRVVKVDGKWLVDFKFIFKHKPDSLYQK